MTPFHSGDRVYVKPIGTVSRIASLVCATDLSGTVTILGFKLTDDIGAGLFTADQLELVAAGEARRLTKTYLDSSA
jgi:hypothetical protein